MDGRKDGRRYDGGGRLYRIYRRMNIAPPRNRGAFLMGWGVPDADVIPFGDSVGCGEVRGGTMKAPPLTLPLTPWRGLRYGLFGRVFLLLLHGDRGNMWF